MPSTRAIALPFQEVLTRGFAASSFFAQSAKNFGARGRGCTRNVIAAPPGRCLTSSSGSSTRRLIAFRHFALLQWLSAPTFGCVAACRRVGARGRGRTGTALKRRDFKSRVSTNFTTRAVSIKEARSLTIDKTALNQSLVVASLLTQQHLLWGQVP
jgi:hypothetical protein